MSSIARAMLPWEIHGDGLKVPHETAERSPSVPRTGVASTPCFQLGLAWSHGDGNRRMPPVKVRGFAPPPKEPDRG